MPAPVNIPPKKKKSFCLPTNGNVANLWHAKKKNQEFQNPPLLPRNGMQNPARQLTAIMGQQCITSLSNAENELNLTADRAISVAGFRQMARI
jgi:hypothetical protein